MENKKEDGIVVGTAKTIWNDPIGKVVLSIAGIFSALLLTGGLFYAGTFTMTAYKNFRDAKNR